MRRDVILSFISWLLILTLSIAGLAVISQAESYQLPGDSFEYLMMPVSIMNHGTTSVTDQDIEDAKLYYGNNIFDTIYRDRADVTLIQGSDGKMYAKHFGLYSVLGIPLRNAFHMVYVNPAKAFQYMNLLYWVAACLIVQLFLRAEQWKKTMLMLFLVFNPAWFYLSWVHTEILMFSLVVISLVMRNNGKYVLSMLFMSFAAMNNLTLLVPSLFLGIEFIIRAYNDNGKKISTVVKKTIPVFLASIPGFIPVIRSFALFGTYSPVAAVASTSMSSDPVDNRFICALSYIFDPNQGMIIYTFLIVPVFLILVVYNLIKRRNLLLTVLDLLCVAAMLFIVSQELHINCGMSYIMRYNIWILPFIAFFDVLNLGFKAAVPVFSVSGLWSLFVIILVSVVSTPNVCLNYTLFGKFFIENFPSLYNPPVGIFYSRTLNEENYYCEYPVPYYDDEGNLRKILLTPEAEELMDEGEWTIYDPDMNPVDFRNLSSTFVNGPQFRYVNISEPGFHMVRDTEQLDFSDLTQTDRSIIVSDVGFEGEQALIYGNYMRLLLHVMPGDYEGSLGIANVFGGEQYVTIKVNGTVVFEGAVGMDEGSIDFDFTVGDDFVCDVVIEVPGALSPMWVIPGSEDNRVLSLYLTEFDYSQK